MDQRILKQLVRRACRLGFSVAEAEDLAQEAVLAYLEQCAKGRTVVAPLPYMMTALRHTALLRRRLAARQHPLSAAPEAQTEDASTARLCSEVLGAIESLPARDRVLLQMVAAGETSPQDLSQRLQVPPGTIMSRLARARARLRAELGEDA
ncbi:MAG: sigma-70 family RNA polymerase sigma factor [Paracoccaceae bacterium]|nr:sigma-70 family RNA polymerase sigma factor [Paracoccaceae bacterium]